MLLSLCVSFTFAWTVFARRETGSDSLMQIIAQFPDYSVAFHFDDYTVEDVEVLIQYVTGPITLINYDKQYFAWRLIGYNYLHIVCLRNVSNFNSARNSFIRYTDIIVLIPRSNDTSPWEIKNINKARGIFVFNALTKTLHSKCFYCGEKGNNIREIGGDVKHYMNDHQNFHGHHFNVAYMPFIPFFWCRTTCQGPEVNLLRLVSEILNFTYSLTNFNYTDGEGKWRLMIEAVHDGQFDWGVGGISVSPERKALVDMTQIIHSESYTIIYRCTLMEDKWNSWRQIAKPFQLNLWICLLCVLIVTVLLIRYIPEYEIPTTVKSICHFSLVGIRIMLEQPSPRLSFESVAKRITFMNWSLACIILITVYKSKIVSMLIDSRYIQFDSLEDFLEHGYTFLVSSLDWSILRETWEAKAKTDKQYESILEKTSNQFSICEAVNEIIHSKAAYIDEISALLYKVVNHCKTEITLEEFSDLCLTENKVVPSHHVWALQLGAPYEKQFSEVIARLHSAGIISFWYKSVLSELLSKTKLQPAAPEIDGLNLTTMICPILILISGWILGCAALFFEIVIYKILCLKKIRDKIISRIN